MREGFGQQLNKINRFLHLSMAYQQGSEMAGHSLMSKHLKMCHLLCGPTRPMATKQRGEHQRPAAAALPEGHGPIICERGSLERRRMAAEHPTEKVF